MSYLEVLNISKKFGKTQILNDVSFTLEKGQVLVILGASGSGKTTLLRILNSLEIADSGNVVIDGEQLVMNKPVRQTIGLVFQGFNLFPHYNVLSNITLALNINNKRNIKEQSLTLPFKERRKFIKAELASKNELAKAEAKDLLSQVGLGDKATFYPYQLSGGQQQRVAIARALILKPKVLCFDEPTSALDPELTGEVLKVIKDLSAANQTMIVVTHELDFAKDVADKVIFMSDGIIEEVGTSNEIFTNPKSEKTKNFIKKRGMPDEQEVSIE